MTIKAVIFDMDGTLTRPFLDFDLIRQEMGLKPDDGPILEAMETMPPECRKYALNILLSHETRAAENAELNEGVSHTLHHLRRRGIRIGVVTRNVMDNVRKIADKFNLEFDAVIDRNDGPAKPDPYGIHKLCELFDCLPNQALFVGDYLHDMLCARAAGTTAVLLKTHPQADEFLASADIALRSIPELLEIIDLESPK